MQNIIPDSSKDSSFGIRSRLFGLTFTYYALRGSDLLFLIIMAAFSLSLIGLIIKKFKIEYSLSSILFILILIISYLISSLAPDATQAYIKSQCFWLIIAVSGITLEKYFFNNKGSDISKNIVWLTGFFLLIVYIFTIFNPQYFWFFENLFLPEGGQVSRYSNGVVRFYTVAAVCFLIIPVSSYRKIPSFLINALPLSPVNIAAWLIINTRTIYYFISLFLIGISILFFSDFGSFLSTQFFSFIDDKSLSVISRSDKISALNLIGSSATFNDDFSETFWVALAQSNGILPAFAFFLFFFYKIYFLSRNLYFIFASFILTSVNPFPLALIYLLAESWNKQGVSDE